MNPSGGFTREWGESIESFFFPLLKALAWFERLMVATPWPIMLVILGALVYAGSRSIGLVSRHHTDDAFDRLFGHVGRHNVYAGAHIGRDVDMHRVGNSTWNSNVEIRQNTGR